MLRIASCHAMPCRTHFAVAVLLSNIHRFDHGNNATYKLQRLAFACKKMHLAACFVASLIWAPVLHAHFAM